MKEHQEPIERPVLCAVIGCRLSYNYCCSAEPPKIDERRCLEERGRTRKGRGQSSFSRSSPLIWFSTSVSPQKAEDENLSKIGYILFQGATIAAEGLHTSKRKRKKKLPRQGTCVMHHHYKTPHVCQPFKTTRDCDKRRLSRVSHGEGRALNGINSPQWWDHDGRFAARFKSGRMIVSDKSEERRQGCQVTLKALSGLDVHRETEREREEDKECPEVSGWTTHLYRRDYSVALGSRWCRVAEYVTSTFRGFKGSCADTAAHPNGKHLKAAVQRKHTASWVCQVRGAAGIQRRESLEGIKMVKTYRLMDDGYPPEKTSSKERQTVVKNNPNMNLEAELQVGLKDVLQGTRNQHRGKGTGVNLAENDGQPPWTDSATFRDSRSETKPFIMVRLSSFPSGYVGYKGPLMDLQGSESHRPSEIFILGGRCRSFLRRILCLHARETQT
ncbi:hypothetical protein D9C73_023811 [Collichthys lucidus]|uniref:Uncharacterized protein n=1 Tax=Collichthys lucidus TaxID=240159 RepID=A0A4U5VMM5_COLLU|nr:hypothetical protein D9C73_023811 [Collichthys lucidus]